jgi:ribosomal protein S18 acetylase RimI-like enzyme
MPDSLQIRQATREDAPVIAELAGNTFVETYGELGLKENMGRYVQDHFAPEQIGAEIASPGHWFYIAFLGHLPVGFVKSKVIREPKGIKGKKCLEIERVYVLKEFQGSSVGKELVKRVMLFARQEKYQVIWLQVWQKNEKAVQFYRKMGFVAYETDIFYFYDEIHHDFLLRFDLYI